MANLGQHGKDVLAGILDDPRKRAKFDIMEYLIEECTECSKGTTILLWEQGIDTPNRLIVGTTAARVQEWYEGILNQGEYMLPMVEFESVATLANALRHYKYAPLREGTGRRPKSLNITLQDWYDEFDSGDIENQLHRDWMDEQEAAKTARLKVLLEKERDRVNSARGPETQDEDAPATPRSRRSNKEPLGTPRPDPNPENTRGDDDPGEDPPRFRGSSDCRTPRRDDRAGAAVAHPHARARTQGAPVRGRD